MILFTNTLFYFVYFVFRTNNHITVDDPLLKELNEALAETSLCFKEEIDTVTDSKNYEIADSPTSLQKRIAFFFDSTLTAFLMMGNLSPVRHCIEIAKLECII